MILYNLLISFLFFNLAQALPQEELIFNAKNSDFQQITSLEEDKLVPILAFLKHEEERCTWIEEYPIITDLIYSMNLRVGCEIGVAYGFQSIFFLENSNIEKLYSIDPYQYFSDYDDPMNFSQPYFDVLYHRVNMRLSRFKERSALLRTTSTNAAQQFSSNSLDFVYIDGDHSYKAVTSDLEAWFDKVRSGGLVSGDDYVVFPSTASAVNDFVHTYQVELSIKGNKWWFIKP